MNTTAIVRNGGIIAIMSSRESSMMMMYSGEVCADLSVIVTIRLYTLCNSFFNRGALRAEWQVQKNLQALFSNPTLFIPSGTHYYFFTEVAMCWSSYSCKNEFSLAPCQSLMKLLLILGMVWGRDQGQTRKPQKIKEGLRQREGFAAKKQRESKKW